MASSFIAKFDWKAIRSNPDSANDWDEKGRQCVLRWVAEAEASEARWQCGNVFVELIKWRVKAGDCLYCFCD